MSELQVRVKVWLKYHLLPFLGDGRDRLPAEGNRSGSISTAASAASTKAFQYAHDADTF